VEVVNVTRAGYIEYMATTHNNITIRKASPEGAEATCECGWSESAPTPYEARLASARHMSWPFKGGDHGRFLVG